MKCCWPDYLFEMKIESLLVQFCQTTRPSATTVNVATSQVQPLLVIGDCIFPSTWIVSFENIQSCGDTVLLIQNARGLLCTTCEAIERLRIKHALPESSSRVVLILPIWRACWGVLLPLPQFRSLRPFYRLHYCNPIRRAWLDVGSSLSPQDAVLLPRHSPSFSLIFVALYSHSFVLCKFSRNGLEVHNCYKFCLLRCIFRDDSGAKFLRKLSSRVSNGCFVSRRYLYFANTGFENYWWIGPRWRLLGQQFCYAAEFDVGFASRIPCWLLTLLPDAVRQFV